MAAAAIVAARALRLNSEAHCRHGMPIILFSIGPNPGECARIAASGYHHVSRFAYRPPRHVNNATLEFRRRVPSDYRQPGWDRGYWQNIQDCRIGQPSMHIATAPELWFEKPREIPSRRTARRGARPPIGRLGSGH